MAKVSYLESGYDFITLYFKDHKTMDLAGKRLYAFLKRVSFKHLDLQRENMVHKPGDVPHFHNGIEATKGPHFHILYPHRPTEDDWQELQDIACKRLVDIQLEGCINEEIS
jgi:thiamine kinase-like enzyme